MKRSKLLQGFVSMAAITCVIMLMTVTVFAATTEIVKDGAFQNTGFINAGAVVDSTIQGPGNWTQLNLGDAAVDEPYLHIIVKATGDTAAAQIVISDKYTFNLVSDLGITLTEEYQDVVLPVQEKGAETLSWANFMGLDGGSSVYTIKDVFLSGDAASTLAAPAVEETSEVKAVAEDSAVPTTGESNTLLLISLVGLTGTAMLLLRQKKMSKIF